MKVEETGSDILGLIDDSLINSRNFKSRYVYFIIIFLNV